MPSEQATLMSTSLRIASMPAATWAISRSSGPRTAATMQNSVAPDLAVCLAASTRLGMSSQALRTGEANSPDCEQKWQSSGQPPVFRLMMPSTSTSGPHQRIRTSWASASSSSSRSSASSQHLQHLLLAQSDAALEHLLPGHGQNVRRVASFGCRSSCRLRHQVLPCIVAVCVRHTCATGHGGRRKLCSKKGNGRRT